MQRNADDAIKRDALRRLGRRAMSRAKLREALVRRWKDEDAVGAVVAELEQAGMLNDRAFAQEAIRQELRKSPAAPRALTHRLLTLGVESDIARDEVERAFADRDLRADAIEFAQKRLRRMGRSLSDDAKARRLAGAMARRGFDSDHIRAALDAMSIAEHTDCETNEPASLHANARTEDDAPDRIRP